MIQTVQSILTLMLITAQVVETSVIVSNSPSEYYIQLYTQSGLTFFMFFVTIYYPHST